MSNNFKDYLLSVSDWSAKALIFATAGLIWNMHVTQNEIAVKLSTYDIRIAALEKQVTFLQANMLTIETLKRVELKLNLVLAQAGIKDKFNFTE